MSFKLMLLACMIAPALALGALPSDKMSCWQLGRIKTVEVPFGSMPRLSADGKWVAFIKSRKLTVMHPESGKTSVIDVPPGQKVLLVRNDGLVVFGPTLETPDDPIRARKYFENGPNRIYDPRTQSVQPASGLVVSGEDLYPLVDVSDGQIIIKSKDGNQTFRRPLNPFQTEEPTVGFGFGDVSKPRVAFKPATRKFVVYEPDGTKRGEIDMHEEMQTNFLPPGAEFKLSGSAMIITMPNMRTGTARTLFYNLKTLTLKELTLPPGYVFTGTPWGNAEQFSDRELVLTSNKGGPAKTLDLETFETKDIPGTDDMVLISNTNGRSCGLIMATNAFSCVEPSGQVTDRLTTLGFPFIRPMGKDRFWIGRSYPGGINQGVFESDFQCIDLPSKTSDPQEIPCVAETKRNSSLKGMNQVGRVLEAELCTRPFAAAEWDAFLGRPNVAELTEGEAVRWLRRFSKPGGFGGKKHLPILLQILEKGFDEPHRREMASALAGIMTSHELLIDDLVAAYPRLLTTLNEPPAQGCQTAADRKLISRAAYDYARRGLYAMKPKLANFAPIAGFARNWLDVPQRTGLADAIADAFALSAGDPELADMFSSKMHKFALQRMNELFGLPYRKLTDTAMTLSNGELTFIQLSHGPFEGSKESTAGFHYRTVRKIPAASISTEGQHETFEWAHDGKQYRSEFQLKRDVTDRRIVTAATGPNYESMWKGGEFRGLLLAGTSLGADEIETMLQHYLKYYADQGFKLSPPKPVADVPKLMKERMSGNEPAHYLIKESHSDGDEKNLLRIPVSGQVVQGVRRLPDGKKETIEIVYPVGDNPKSVLLANRTFGKWMREREKKGGPELIYLNSSCGSKSKALFEIGAAATPLLINVPTNSIARVFRNTDTSAMYQLVDSVRKGRNFAETREALKKNEEYAAGKENLFIFPDEAVYEQEVTAHVTNPIDAEGSVYEKGPNGAWQPYTIEDEPELPRKKR